MSNTVAHFQQTLWRISYQDIVARRRYNWSRPSLAAPETAPKKNTKKTLQVARLFSEQVMYLEEDFLYRCESPNVIAVKVLCKGSYQAPIHLAALHVFLSTNDNEKSRYSPLKFEGGKWGLTYDPREMSLLLPL